MLFLSLNTVAQTDTLVIIKTDTVFMPEKEDLMYKLFLENRGVETNHLWKLNLVDLAVLRPNLGYEHRLGRSWSVEGYGSLGFNGNLELEYEENDPIPFPTNNFDYVIEFEQQFKYYYNLTRRKKIGKKTHGFRGNYVASSFWYKSSHGESTNNQYYPSIFHFNSTQYNAGLKYGLQRRIGNIGYIDFSIGAYYRWESITGYSYSDRTEINTKNNRVVLSIGIKAGFAIDSFKNLKK